MKITLMSFKTWFVNICKCPTWYKPQTVFLKLLFLGDPLPKFLFKKENDLKSTISCWFFKCRRSMMQHIVKRVLLHKYINVPDCRLLSKEDFYYYCWVRRWSNLIVQMKATFDNQKLKIQLFVKKTKIWNKSIKNLKQIYHQDSVEGDLLSNLFVEDLDSCFETRPT